MAVLQINILGTSFAMDAEADLPYLEKIRDYYKNVCEEIQRNDGIADQKQIAVLAGILIADELHKEKLKNIQPKSKSIQNDERIENEANRLTKNMIDKIDRALQ